MRGVKQVKIIRGVKHPPNSPETPVTPEIPVRAGMGPGASRSGYSKIIEESKLVLVQNVNGWQCLFSSMLNAEGPNMYVYMFILGNMILGEEEDGLVKNI